MKAKRFTCQQILKQEKPIDNEDLSSSYEGKRLVGEKEINESHQVGNILFKISKQEKTIFNLSEQLDLFQFNMKCLTKSSTNQRLYLLQISTSQENKYDYIQQPSSQVVSMQIENLEYQKQLPQFYQLQISSTQEDKNKGISERLEKIERILIKRQKNKQSEKDADIVNQHSTQLEAVKTLKTVKQDKKKRRQDRSQDFEQQEKEFTRRKYFNVKTKRESKLVNLPNKKGRGILPSKTQRTAAISLIP